MSTGSEVRPILQEPLSATSPAGPESTEPERLAGFPRPTDIARIVEGYDEEDWYQFLDQMDEVYRRRRQRELKPDAPTGTDRQSIADWIARKHLVVDRTIKEIHYLPTDSPSDEIHLIEVNDRLARPDDTMVQPLEYVVDTVENPFRVFIADVNSDELEAIKSGRAKLPLGWKWEKNELISYARRHVS